MKTNMNDYLEQNLQSCTLFRILLYVIWWLWHQKQVSQAGISNHIPQNIVGCNYLCLPEVSTSSTKVLISFGGHFTLPCGCHRAGLQQHWRNGASSQYKDRLLRYEDFIIKIRRSWDRLIFIMGIHILVRRHLYIETVPRWINVCMHHEITISISKTKQNETTCVFYGYALWPASYRVNPVRPSNAVNMAINGSSNDLSPVRRQNII